MSDYGTLQGNTHEALMNLATDVMDGKYGEGDDFRYAEFRKALEEELAFILEDD